MKITVKQVGGIVGLLTRQIDTDQLSPDQQHEVYDLLKSSDLLRHAKQNLVGSNTPNYQVIIETNKQCQQVTLPAGSRTPAEASLVRFVQQKGHPVPLS